MSSLEVRISVLAAVVSAMFAVAAWVKAGNANKIAEEALDAQTASRIRVRCRRGMDQDLPGPVTVVLAIAENIGGFPVTINQVYIMWFRRDGKKQSGHSFSHALESETGTKFPFPELPHTLEPRETLRVPIPEQWFQRDLEVQLHSELGNREFTFRFEDSTGAYYETPRMSIKCHQEDCPYWTPADASARRNPLSLRAIPRQVSRLWRCR